MDISQDFDVLFNFRREDLLLVMCLAVIFTLIRSVLSRFFLMVKMWTLFIEQQMISPLIREARLLSSDVICLNVFCSQPMGRYLALTDQSSAKLPESVWKLIYYGSIWIYSFRVIVSSGKYRFFQNPSSVWEGKL